MALYVQKYGGTSVATVERINAVADRVCRFHRDGHELVVVVSAMGGETDRLEALGDDISSQPDPREMDVLLAAGEQVSIALMALALQARSVQARSYLAHQVRILTDSSHRRSRIQDIDLQHLRRDLSAGVVPVVAGAQGV
ncbi:MAG: aspartate kinase, partial [Pseudomonadales bacterium]